MDGVVGAIQAYNEAGNIGEAVRSLLAAGASRVVVLDGAWPGFDHGAARESTDGTREEASAAGAEVVTVLADDAGKRQAMVELLLPGEHLLFIDADERISGRIEWAPAGHGCVVLRNDKPNDLPWRTRLLDREYRATVPMLRWLSWSPSLRCAGPGNYVDGGCRVHAYRIGELADLVRDGRATKWQSDELRRLRAQERELPDEELSALPIVRGIQISHAVEANARRIADKERYYTGGAG